MVREPLGHFVAGFDQIEFNYETISKSEFQADPDADQSAWMKSYDAGEPTLARSLPPPLPPRRIAY